MSISDLRAVYGQKYMMILKNILEKQRLWAGF